MRATIRDPQSLAKVRPLDLTAYLRTRGWKEKQRSAGSFAVWTLSREGGDSFEVLLPLDTTYRDYALRIGDVLRTLERVEERSQLELLADVATSFADRVRIRALSSGSHEGSIALDAGIELMRNAREMMLAAACAAIEPRAHYPSRKPDRAMKYLSSLDLGQTERGSFVVTILSPVPPVLQGALFPEAEEPWERRVTTTLSRAAAAAREAAEESVATGELEPFQRAVREGVSAKASRIFREAGTEEAFELLGYVISLKRGESEEKGTVTISGLVDGSLRKVRMELAGAAYERIVHRNLLLTEAFSVDRLA